MMTFTIAPVAAEDLGDLLALMRAYCDFYSVSPTDDDLLDLSRALIADPEHEGRQFIARGVRGDALGFASLYWTWDTTEGGRIAVMNDLYVDPRSRGHGIATELIERMPDGGSPPPRAVASSGRPRLTTTRAQAVYEHLGAQRAQWLDYSLPVIQGP